MSFTTKSRLLELMNTMTASEKRYLRQFVNKTGEAKSNHIQLLEAIIKQDNYDEGKLKRKFRGTSIVKQWSRVKNYLYNYILRVLQNYHQQDPALELLNIMQQITILYNKGIYGEAHKLLVKVKSLAIEGIYPTLLPFIAEWEMRLEVACYDINNKKIPRITKENNKRSIEIAENVLMYYRYQKDIIRNRSQEMYMSSQIGNLKTLNNPIFTSAKTAKSPMAKLIFHTSRCFLYAQAGQFMAAYYEAQKQLEVHQQAPLLQKQAPLSYVTSVNNLVINSVKTKQWDHISLMMEKMDLLIQKNKVLCITVLVTSVKYIALLKKCIETMQFEKGLQYRTEIEEFIEDNRKYTNQYVQSHLLLYYLVQIHVISGKYSLALKMIDALEKSSKSPTFIPTILLLKLICLYEEEAFFLLPHAIRSVYRKLLKNKKLCAFERIVLNLLKASINAPSKRELKIIFRRYWLQFNELRATTPIAKLGQLEHFNYLAWVESKVKGVSLIELLKEQELIRAKAG